jgi:Family of unknown function (DUF5906)
MSNDIMAYEPEDDGFSGSLKSGRLLKGALIKWNDNNHWADRDGLTPPSPLLVVAINEILQKWKDGKADIINEKPLPSVNARLPRMSVLDPHGQPVRNVKREVITISPTHWLDQNRPVEQMTWCPGLPMLITNRRAVLGGWIERPDVTCFNLYRPPRLELGDASQAGPWLEHLHAVFNPDDATHILRWLAHRVQLPGQKINHALVLGGPQGIGKDTLLEPVKHAVGPWNFQEVSPVHLLGRFNGFVKPVILRVSEARDLGEINRFSFYDHTKVYTAAPPDVLRVDEKHLREHYVFNCLGFIITTNHKTDGIYLPADDRRHYVAWSPRTKDEFTSEYWNRLWGWYLTGGFRHVAAYLGQLDLTDFDSKAPPAKTAAFWDIVAANNAPEDAELADVLDTLGNPDAVTLEQLIEQAVGRDAADWLLDRKNRRAIPHRMERCGYVPVRNPDADDGLWKVVGKRQTVYAKATLAPREQIAAARSVGA